MIKDYKTDNTDSISSEISYTNTRKITFFEYLYVFVMIIYAGGANTFVLAVDFTSSLVGYSLPIILSVILALKWRIKFTREFFLLIFCLFLYFIAVTIKYKEIHPSIFTFYLQLFFIAYVTIRVFNFNFFSIYEFLLYRLALIGIALWVVQTILRGDTLYNYFSKIPGIHTFSFVSGYGGISIFLYSLQPTTTSLLYGFSVPRNCGFAWEPGGFAIFLCLAMFVNLFMTNPKNKFNLQFWVLLIALLSTQSTTGYSIFIIIMLFYYLNKRSEIIIFIMPIIVIASISVFFLPFMSKKIITFIKDTNDIDYIVWQSIGNESPTDPQRFTSFLISFKDFYDNPILGNAGITGESWYSKIGANISPISGLGNLLANFGIIGFLFFIIFSLKTSVFFSRQFSYRGRYLLFIIILFVTVSYSLIFAPLVMGFWMFKFFCIKGDNPHQIVYTRV